jgi:hypothetical protein
MLQIHAARARSVVAAPLRDGADRFHVRCKNRRRAVHAKNRERQKRCQPPPEKWDTHGHHEITTSVNRQYRAWRFTQL